MHQVKDSQGFPPGARCFFRDELRKARATCLSDAEGFHELITAMERLGAYLNGGGAGFGACRDPFRRMLGTASRPEQASVLESEFDVLFGLIREGRNAAVHEGAFARHLTRHCTELALILEDALMANSETVADFMVREPVCAALWQPVGVVRRQMLLNSFSFLPLQRNERWHLVSDHSVAKYLASASDRRRALAVEVGEAVSLGLELEPAEEVPPGCSRAEALGHTSASRPLLVVESGRLLGVVTPFDLL